MSPITSYSICVIILFINTFVTVDDIPLTGIFLKIFCSSIYVTNDVISLPGISVNISGSL